MSKFVKLWIGSCLFYMADIFILFLIFSRLIPSEVAESMLAILFNILSVYALWFVFSACCAIDNIPIKKFWERYILLLIIYSAVLRVSNSEQLIIALPFYLYQIVLNGGILFTIFSKWRFSLGVKIWTAFIISAGSIFQLYCSLNIIVKNFSFSVLYADVCFLLLLNFTMTYLHQKIWNINLAIRDDYLYALAEKAVDIIFYYTLRPFPRFSFISPSVENIVGYKQSDFYRNPKLYLELTHEDDRDIIQRAFSSEAVSVNKNFIRWQRKDGEFIYLEFHNTPIFYGGKLTAVEGILRDITDRKMVEKEMLDSKKSKQILLSYISHELKTPITYIVGYAEALQNNLYLEEADKKNAIDLISTKAVFLQKLVDDLFQLSKMEANQFSFEFIQTKVYSLYRFLEEKHKHDLMNTGIHYTTMIEDRLKDEKYEVLVDIKRIQQVFGNLLHNAINHTPANGSISCQCSLDEKKEQIIFKIIDSGVGIPKEDLPYIFKAFYRGKTKASQSKEGSGLGLSLSAQIIQAHKGTIEVESNKGKGSIFVFTIPLYSQEG
ncbi:sensor histidine kinase [Sinanaerobacter chloroacetimidivorans]|jgi:PAS domain S-box-containing protein|uniref:histidine kinase n=1 Tax=Sinanaerobacter chloroacetimidivorans TaxID=2818044 RepID=A0A8J7VZU8_9FIRM|nr:PAS domain-containing sensor histidine kinase [Sinanaerobacter chloroacetimidivorans]MBR0598169.1 PAS domain S-box protein [Sinanaerobacter chloroacetimidivorans]